MASPKRLALERVTSEELSVPIKVVCRMQLANSCGVDGTQREFPSSLRQIRRQSAATSPWGFSREAFVTRMHMTATIAATEEESAPPEQVDDG